MKRLLLASCVVACFIPAGPAAAGVNAIVHAARAAYDRGDYVRALELYTTAIRAGATKPTTFYNAACSAALAGRPGDAFQYLDRAIDAGYTKAGHLAADDDFVTLRGDPRWPTLLARLRAASAAQARVDTVLRDELLAMREDHMAVRRDRRRGGARGPTLGDQRASDAKRTKRLQEIIQQRGWPGRSLVGVDAAHAAWLIARHADELPFRRRCLVLMQSAGPGEVAPQDLASLTDAILLDEGKKQAFGTQFHKRNGKLAPRPLEDPAHVDERRKALGLPPLAEYQRLLEQRRAAAADSAGS